MVSGSAPARWASPPPADTLGHSYHPTKAKGGGSEEHTAPRQGKCLRLLQAVQREVEGELCNHRRAAPVGSQATRIDRRDLARIEVRGLRAGVDRAVRRRHVGVVV